MSFVLGADHVLAQLAASIAFADAGAQASRVRIYAETEPATGANPVASPMVDVVLAKPCGAIVGGALVLYVGDAGGAMVLRQGIPRSAQWISGAGQLVGAGTVTDMGHDGDFRVAGGSTPEGDTSPMFYAGGLMLLGDVVFD